MGKLDFNKKKGRLKGTSALIKPNETILKKNYYEENEASDFLLVFNRSLDSNDRELVFLSEELMKWEQRRSWQNRKGLLQQKYFKQTTSEQDARGVSAKIGRGGDGERRLWEYQKNWPRRQDTMTRHTNGHNGD